MLNHNSVSGHKTTLPTCRGRTQANRLVEPKNSQHVYLEGPCSLAHLVEKAWHEMFVLSPAPGKQVCSIILFFNTIESNRPQGNKKNQRIRRAELSFACNRKQTELDTQALLCGETALCRSNISLQPYSCDTSVFFSLSSNLEGQLDHSESYVLADPT